MQLEKAPYTFNSFVRKCSQKIQETSKNLQIVTLISHSESDIKISELFRRAGLTINDLDFGEVTEVKFSYMLHKEEREVYYYILNHPEYKGVYFLLTFGGIVDIYRTLFGMIDYLPEVYYLWLPPSHFDALRLSILQMEGSYMTSFRGKRMEDARQECKRPMFARKFSYEGDDAKTTLEEVKFEYGVFPEAIEFVIPGKSKFKINKKGYYTLIYGDVGEFLNNVVDNFIKRVIKDNQEIEKAKLKIERMGNLETLDMKEVIFELAQELTFEEMGGFIKAIEDSGFSLYNTNLEKGSVIFSSHLVDEAKGNIFSITSDGKRFTVVPKYKANFTSIIHFHRFLIEKIDQFTKIIYS